MQETTLVMQMMETLVDRNCNAHVTVKLGENFNHARFKTIFKRYAEGTYFQHVDLRIEQAPGEQFEIVEPAPLT